MMGSEVSPLKEKIKHKICTLHQKLPAILFLQRFDLTEIFNSHLSNLTNLISAKSFTSVLRFAFFEFDIWSSTCRSIFRGCAPCLSSVKSSLTEIYLRDLN